MSGLAISELDSKLNANINKKYCSFFIFFYNKYLKHI